MDQSALNIDGASVCPKDPPLTLFEKSVHALLVILSTKMPMPLITTDELRRAVESLDPQAYDTWSYYDRWAAAIASLLLERGVINDDELHAELTTGGIAAAGDDEEFLFTIGDRVRVKHEDFRHTIRWRKPHLRCPGYIFGLSGMVTHVIGEFEDPTLKAFRISIGSKQPLYRVSFKMSDIEATRYYSSGASGTDDEVVVDVYQPWLEVAAGGSADVADVGFQPLRAYPTGTGQDQGMNQNQDQTPHIFQVLPSVKLDGAHDDGHHHDHRHDHHHDHAHEERDTVEANAVALEGDDSGPGRLVGEALLRLLQRKGIATTEQITTTIDRLDAMGQRLAGADLVVKAWVDEAFKQRLLTDAAAAAAELGINVSNPNAPTVLTVVADTSTTHNLVVCTLCSCYPASVLGLSPAWYRSRSYRSRVVQDPRAVLAEFGTVVPPGMKVVVYDSTADCRYMVLPLRPAGTEGWSEADLRKLVTRDSMVGVRVLNSL